MERGKMDKAEMKLQALKESFASKVVDYEERIAELRVELTVLNNSHQEALGSLRQHEERANQQGMMEASNPYEEEPEYVEAEEITAEEAAGRS